MFINPTTNMKQARVCIHVSMGDRGQQRRPVLLNYQLAAPLKGYLYHIIGCHDVHKPDHYPVDGPTGILALNGQELLDELIAAANPDQVEFARKELGCDLTSPVKSASKPKPRPRPEPEGEQLPFA